jgi:hypothetical protein
MSHGRRDFIGWKLGAGNKDMEITRRAYRRDRDIEKDEG